MSTHYILPSTENITKATYFLIPPPRRGPPVYHVSELYLAQAPRSTYSCPWLRKHNTALAHASTQDMDCDITLLSCRLQSILLLLLLGLEGKIFLAFFLLLFLWCLASCLDFGTHNILDKLTLSGLSLPPCLLAMLIGTWK